MSPGQRTRRSFAATSPRWTVPFVNFAPTERLDDLVQFATHIETWLSNRATR